MDNDNSLTPDQRVIPRFVRRLAYNQVPQTCDIVWEILQTLSREVAETYAILPEDQTELDAIVCRAMQGIRERATQPLRTAQMQALVKLEQKKASAVFSGKMARAIENEASWMFEC